MYLDIDVIPSKRTFYMKGAFLLVVLGFGWLAGMAWWQFLIVLLLFCGIFYVEYGRQIPLFALSTNDVNDVWYLGMYDESEREIWQGYLANIEPMSVMGEAVRLTFEVVVPVQMTYSAVIFRADVDDENFAKLSALARFNAFQ